VADRKSGDIVAVLAKRATLFSHLAVIVLTPLAVVIARKWILGVLIAIMAVASIPLIAAGRFDWQNIPDGAKQLLIGVALLAKGANSRHPCSGSLCTVSFTANPGGRRGCLRAVKAFQWVKVPASQS